MTMATMKRVVIYYLLLELNHDNGHNKERVVIYYLLLELIHDNGCNEESSNLLLTTGANS
jgi:NADH/NAD ratio-sensing transcriptional regulator Rex